MFLSFSFILPSLQLFSCQASHPALLSLPIHSNIVSLCSESLFVPKLSSIQSCFSFRLFLSLPPVYTRSLLASFPLIPVPSFSLFFFSPSFYCILLTSHLHSFLCSFLTYCTHLHLNLYMHTSTPFFSFLMLLLIPSFFPIFILHRITLKTERRNRTNSSQFLPWVLPFKWILTQQLLISHYPFIALFHLSVHPFIPVPSFMTGLSADINQLR